MSIEKTLHKIQSQINDIAPVLELFLDETIQPSVDNCENLQKQLTILQENLAIYKYHKTNKELSPSFTIHEKLSKVELPKDNLEEIVKEIKSTIEEPKVEIPPLQTNPIIEKIPEENIKKAMPLAIGINDKFRFINELFKQNNSEYSVAIEQLNTLKNWTDTENYLNSLKTLYNWKENTDVVAYFFSIVKKRFN